MTATKSLPPADYLSDYAQKLPKIYRDVLAAFQLADPNRRYGEGLFLATLRNYYLGKYCYPNGTTSTTTTPPPDRNDWIPTIGIVPNASSKTDDFVRIIDRLADAGFLYQPDEVRFGLLTPTDLGEALIAAITGRQTAKVELPELPPLVW